MVVSCISIGMRPVRPVYFARDQAASPAPAPEPERDDEDLSPEQMVYPGNLSPSIASPPKVRFSLESRPYSRDTKIRLIEDHHKSLQRNFAARRPSPSPLKLPTSSPSRLIAPAIQQVTTSPDRPVNGRLEAELRRLETDIVRENLVLKACVLQLREEQLEDLFQRQAVVAELEEMRKHLREKGRIEEIRSREMMTAYLKLEEGRKVLEKVGEGWKSLSPGKRRTERQSTLDAYLVPSPFLEPGKRREVFKTRAVPVQTNPFYSNSNYFHHSTRSYVSSKRQLALLPHRAQR